MQAEWNVYKTMSIEQALRNTCRQIEQEYVDWSRKATHKGYLISREFPYIGEHGRTTVQGVLVRFVTTRKRSIQVQKPDHTVIGEFKMQAGLAKELYACAGALLDLPDVPEN